MTVSCQIRPERYKNSWCEHLHKMLSENYIYIPYRPYVTPTSRWQTELIGTALDVTGVTELHGISQCRFLKNLGAFAKLRKATLSLVMSVYTVVRPHEKTRLPLDGSSWNFRFESLSKICWYQLWLCYVIRKIFITHFILYSLKTTYNFKVEVSQQVKVKVIPVHAWCGLEGG